MKPRKFSVIGILWLLFIILLPIKSNATKIPEPTSNFYLDQLNLLSDESKEEINKTNRELEKKTGSQVIVISQKNVDEDPVQFATEIFNKWKIGDKDKKNGVLIFLSENSEGKRHIDIITGYGIEGRLNDGKVGRIIDEYMISDMRNGDFDKGLIKGFRIIISEISKEYNISIENNDTDVDLEEDTNEEGGSFIRNLIIIIILLIILSRKGNGRGIFGGGFYGGFGGSSFGGGSFGGSSGGFSGGGGSSGGGGAGRGI